VPGLEPYFITSHFDDFDSVAGFYGPASPSALRGIVHGFTTMPGMIAVICCAVSAVLVAILLLFATHDPMLAGTAGLIAFAITFVVTLFVAYRTATVFARTMEAKWPAPGPPSAGDREG